MKAYPIELRKRVLHAVDYGIRTREQIAAMFSVSTFWIRKLLRQRRDLGDISPQPQNQGRKRYLPVRTCKNLMRLSQPILMPLLKRSKSISQAPSIAALWQSITRSSALGGTIKKIVTCIRAKQAGCSIAALVVEKGTALNGFDQACIY